MTPTPIPGKLPELLPCPFCGGDAKLRLSEWKGRPDLYWVECPTKGCPGKPGSGGDDETLAITVWNTRAEIALGDNKCAPSFVLQDNKGFVLAPEMPTDAMLDEAEKGADLVHLMQFEPATRRIHFRLVYLKMLAAPPEAQP